MMVNEDCAGIENGDAFIDACGICTDGTTGLSPNYLMDCLGVCNGNASEIDCGQTILIFYNSTTEITGFQFKIIGDINILEGVGGAAENSGFSVTTGNNIVLGFSFMGNSINAGNGLLTALKYEGSIGQYCLDNLVLSGPDAITLNAEINNCNTIIYGN
tara:strand:- start:466 stop:942 length:477 start_codon:yes stop_codon:yes gene_type:complete